MVGGGLGLRGRLHGVLKADTRTVTVNWAEVGGSRSRDKTCATTCKSGAKSTGSKEKVVLSEWFGGRWAGAKSSRVM